jgi:hypothetical protein
MMWQDARVQAIHHFESPGFPIRNHCQTVSTIILAGVGPHIVERRPRTHHARKSLASDGLRRHYPRRAAARAGEGDGLNGVQYHRWLPGAGSDCTNTVFLSTDTPNDVTGFIGGSIAGADPALADFTTSFNDWNAANGNLWTLINGGTLNMPISATLSPAIGSGGGGVGSIIVTLGDYTPTTGQPSLSQLVWTQALFTNYTPTGGVMNSPVVTLDTYSVSAGSPGSGGAFQSPCVPIPGRSPGANNNTPSTIGAVPTNSAYCDPIYPFQYGTEFTGDTLNGMTLSDNFFFDAPEAT